MELKLAYEIRKPPYAQGKTVRKSIGVSLWNKIRNEIYKRDNHNCSICGYSEGELHAHEVFEYDEINYVIKLVAIQSLCTYCHSIKHFYFTALRLGNSKLTKEEQEVKFMEYREHFKKVNQCSDEIAINDYRRAQIEAGVIFDRKRDSIQDVKLRLERLQELKNKSWTFLIYEDMPYFEEVTYKLKQKRLLYV